VSIRLSQGMAPRQRGTQAIDLPMWVAAMRCQKKTWELFRGLACYNKNVSNSIYRCACAPMKKANAETYISAK
jgi:hypothetical protein